MLPLILLFAATALLIAAIALYYILIFKPLQNEKIFKKEEQKRKSDRLSFEAKSSFSESINQGFKSLN